MSTLAFEVNFDGLVGMTHTYGGLSLGNLPSMENRGHVSNPRQAAHQGLEKMKLLHTLGVRQAVLPPQERPFVPILNQLGFSGNVQDVITRITEDAPWLLYEISSSASMWAANAANVSPSIDSSDSHVHFTPANLASNFHRAIEAETTGRILKAIFPNPVFFEHHSPLPSNALFYDEGAANHTRFCRNYHSAGVQLFVYGKSSQDVAYSKKEPQKFPARQTLEASNAVSRLHALYPDHYVFAQQNPDAIDAGAFHNDMMSVGNLNVFLVHELAFKRQKEVLDELRKKVSQYCDVELNAIEVKEKQVPMKEALACYLFNSQIVSLPDGSMVLIAPTACQQNDKIQTFLKEISEDKTNPIAAVRYVDLSQSMANGGGPACLRLRVVLNENELAETNPGVLFNDTLFNKLKAHVDKYYPTHLTLEELGNPSLYERNCESLAELTKILNLGKVYNFQRT